MMRYIYCICLLVGSMGLPLLAKSPSAANLPSSCGKGTKGVPASPSSSPAVTDAKEQSPKKPAVTLISDRSRAELSAAVLAAKPQAQKPSPTPAASTASTAAKKIVTAKMDTKTTVKATSNTHPSLAKSAPDLSSDEPDTEQRLARVTAYWAGEGDYYTGRCISSTGVRLHDGHCAVDPNIIPYGSVVEIAGVGKFLAVDTGSAVINRTAARESGHNSAERGAIVVDLFFENAREGERFAAGAAKFVRISWWTPHSVASQNAAAGGLFADENWTKIQSKQL